MTTIEVPAWVRIRTSYSENGYRQDVAEVQSWFVNALDRYNRAARLIDPANTDPPGLLELPAWVRGDTDREWSSMPDWNNYLTRAFDAARAMVTDLNAGYAILDAKKVEADRAREDAERTRTQEREDSDRTRRQAQEDQEADREDQRRARNQPPPQEPPEPRQERQEPRQERQEPRQEQGPEQDILDLPGDDAVEGPRPSIAQNTSWKAKQKASIAKLRAHPVGTVIRARGKGPTRLAKPRKRTAINGMPTMAPFEASGQWTVQSAYTDAGWKGALIIPSGPGREHVTLTATVPREMCRALASAFRAAFRAEHQRLHAIEGMEVVGSLAAEIGVPWWQQLLPVLAQASSLIPVVGPVVSPLATAAMRQFSPTIPQAMPGLNALAQTGPGPRALQDIPGAPGGLLAALQGAAGALGPLFGGAGLLAQGAQMVSGAPEHFGAHALPLANLLDAALRTLDCHAAALSADYDLANAAARALGMPPVGVLQSRARAIANAILPPSMHVAGDYVGEEADQLQGPAQGYC